MSEAGEGVQELHDETKSKEFRTQEQVFSLPGQIHDFCVSSFASHYTLGPEKRPYLFHTYHDRDRKGNLISGHVETVKNISDLYISAVLDKTRREGLPFPDNTTDPLRLFQEAKDHMQTSPESVLPTDERLMDLIPLVYTTSSSFHDIMNVATGIDWQHIDASDPSAGVEPSHEMRSYFSKRIPAITPEEAAGQVYRTYLYHFQKELSLSDDEVGPLSLLGKSLIRNTNVRNGFQAANSQLSLFDQTGALFSPNGYKEVWGLINEWGTNMETMIRSYLALKRHTSSDEIPAEEIEKFSQQIGMVDPRFLFEGFIPSQMQAYESQKGPVLQPMWQLIEEYVRKDPDSASVYLGTRGDQLLEIRSLQNFLMSRLQLRGAISRECWPQHDEKGIPAKMDMVTFFDSAGDEYLRFIDLSSEAMQQRFWDPSFGIEEIKSLYKRSIT